MLAPAPGEGDDRSAELSSRLAAVRDRIAAAAKAAGRDPGELTLIVVCKTWPVDDVRRLAALGVSDVGENRDQEAVGKHEACRDLDLRWHFIGRLQTNKARSVIRWADLVHSVDRPEAVRALAAAATAAERRVGSRVDSRVDRPVDRRVDSRVDCLVQVSLDGDPRRGGVPVPDVEALADSLAAEPALRLRGVMAVAPLGAEPARAFDVLAEVAARVRSAHPGADVVSAGMSSDLEAAVEAGATHLRVGSAILGARPRLR